MRKRPDRGFTVVELMVAIVIVGVLAGIAAPMFMAHASNAKATEALLQLDKIARNATLYYQEHRSFPQGTAAVLPGADRSACAQTDRLLPVSSDWDDDPVWSALDMVIGEKTRFSYHYEATSKKSAHVWAVADFGCNGNVVVYELYLEGRASGHVSFAIVDPLSKRKATRPAAESDEAESDAASEGDISDGGTSSSSSGGSSAASGSTGTSSGSTGASSGSTGSSSGNTGSSAGSTGSSGSSSSSSGSSTSSGGTSSSSGGASAGGTTVTVGGSTDSTVCIQNGNSGSCKKTK